MILFGFAERFRLKEKAVSEHYQKWKEEFRLKDKKL